MVLDRQSGGNIVRFHRSKQKQIALRPLDEQSPDSTDERCAALHHGHQSSGCGPRPKRLFRILEAGCTC